MSEPDVTRTLSEIRERVRVQLRTQSSDVESKTADCPGVDVGTKPELESLRANLSVLERSRNRLPPVTSYRHGWVASFELAIKRLIKRITHWFTWEQVNFNAATVNSLAEISRLVALHEQVLTELRAQMKALKLQRAETQREFAPNEYKGNHFQNGSPAAQQTKMSEAQESEIDVEIKKLAARLEELRATKTRTS